MKVIRTYKLIKDVLYCNVDILSDQVDFQDELHWTDPDYRGVQLSAIVGPSATRKDDLKVNALRCSRSFLFEEIIRFCNVIKSMYEL